MDSVKLNKDGITPVKGLFGEISAIKSRKQVRPLMAEFYHEGISGLFYTSIDADAKDSKNNLVSIGQEGMTLSERSYYLDTDSESVALRDKYKKTIIDLFQLYGFSHAQAYANMKTIINIETEMAKVAYSRTELRDPEKNNNKIGYNQLMNQYQGIDWNTDFSILEIKGIISLNMYQGRSTPHLEKKLNNKPKYN